MIHIHSTLPTHFLLRQYVRMYYTGYGRIDRLNSECIAKSYASGSSYLVFVFENGTMGIENEYNRLIFKSKVYLVTGYFQPTSLCLHMHDLNYFIVMLYPHTIYTLFGISLEELQNQFDLDADVLGQPWIYEMHEKMYTMQDHRLRTNLFEMYLLRYISKNNVYFDPKINYILYKNNFLKLNELSQTLGYSNRYIQNLVKINTNMTYTQYRNIRQFQVANQLIISSKTKINFSKIAVATHYTDQSHMIHSFKKFTQKTPKELLDESKKLLISNVYYFTGVIE